MGQGFTLTKTEKRNQDPRVILRAIYDPEVHEVTTSISHEMVQGDDGLNNLIKLLDDCF